MIHLIILLMIVLIFEEILMFNNIIYESIDQVGKNLLLLLVD
jgi:hypothetical protein